MTLTLGFIATSPGEQTQGDEVTHEFELVDVQPPDAYDHERATEETEDSNEDTSDEESEGTSDEDSTEDSDAEDSEFTYENCAAAQADGAAPVLEGERGFGPHLDADNDGIGCEQWGTPSDTTENDQTAYENCAAAQADGAAPVREGEPGFGPHLDADNDGIGCEQ
ncbi:excalibur calcium-binding domain-containing protein [Glycomyces arizonensis]|uniref:excalibur calcium-binding domain-containing protein n=1 Tax=Glycomyces arizonensis TaxID=256035 RepID=UPI00041BACEE|nr:excalibur calcium-binding domain-containing protein [Glycomyces arizonensis]